MSQPRSIPELKKAIKAATKVFAWVPFAATSDGNAIGGYVEVYKTHILRPFGDFKLPSVSWDKSVQCFFREADDGSLYIEGFQSA